MRRTILVLNCAVAGVLGALVVAVVALLLLMAATPEPGVRRTALFGAVFFESAPSTGGALTVGAGVADPAPLAVLAAVLTVACLLASLLHRRRSQGRPGHDAIDEP